MNQKSNISCVVNLQSKFPINFQHMNNKRTSLVYNLAFKMTEQVPEPKSSLHKKPTLEQLCKSSTPPFHNFH
jgi:hypothetical protein